MTKKNRHFKKSRKNVRRKNYQTGGAFTMETIENMTNMATSGLDVINKLTHEGKCHVDVITALNEIIKSSMNILKVLQKKGTGTVENHITNIATKLNVIVQSLGKEDLESMAKLLTATLDQFGSLLEQMSKSRFGTIDWLDSFRVLFSGFAGKGGNTIDTSIAKLAQAQCAFAKEYMGNSINTTITKEVNAVNNILNQGAEASNAVEKVDKNKYTVFKVLIASLVCTFDAATSWDHKTTLVETCRLLKLAYSGKIFENFYNLLQGTTSTFSLIGTGISFSAVFAGNYITTYASSFSSPNYEEIRRCTLVKDPSTIIAQAEQMLETEEKAIARRKEEALKLGSSEDTELPIRKAQKSFFNR